MIRRIISYGAAIFGALWVIASAVAWLAGWSTVPEDSLNALSLLRGFIEWFFTLPPWGNALFGLALIIVNTVYLYRPHILLQRIDELNRPWFSSDEAAQFLFDRMRDNDMCKGLVQAAESITDAMHHFLEDGVQRGLIRARGRQIYTKSVDVIPKNVVLDCTQMIDEGNGYEGDLFAIDSEADITWRNLQFYRHSLKMYVRDLERDTALRERQRIEAKRQQ